MKNIKDKSEELLHGRDALEAFRRCYTCVNISPCTRNNWAITTDKDGKTCDNYEPASPNTKPNLKRF